MKLLLDENLSVQLTELLSALYPGLEHVHNVHLGSSDDGAIWDYAKQHGFTIVSKDSDFAERCVLESDPPKIVWIRLGNCPTSEIEQLLRSAHDTIRTFIEEDEEVCLLLGRA